MSLQKLSIDLFIQNYAIYRVAEDITQRYLN